jgi:hypothetical protein
VISQVPTTPHASALAFESVETVQREDFSEYVAHLQLHMALQTRNLVPSLSQPQSNSRNQLLVQTQADVEKQVSRQIF